MTGWRRSLDDVLANEPDPCRDCPRCQECHRCLDHDDCECEPVRDREEEVA